MNFGKRMAQIRKDNMTKIFERLYRAKKEVERVETWSFSPNEQIIGAIRTIESLGMTAEVRYVDDKVKLFAVKYRSA